MNRNSYYVHFYNPEIPQAYRLYYLQDPADRILLPDRVYKCTRKNAERLARDEQRRRRRRRPTAGLSDDAAFPVWIPNARETVAQNPCFYFAGWIWLPNDNMKDG